MAGATGGRVGEFTLGVTDEATGMENVNVVLFPTWDVTQIFPQKRSTSCSQRYNPSFNMEKWWFCYN